jgi:RNase P protein component
MLPKKHRITKKLFDIIMKEGFFVSGAIFNLRYIAQKASQYAVVAPKSISPQANIRNKLRRQGYNALRSLNPKSQIAGILFYKKEAKSPLYEDIKKDIGTILSKLR